MGLEAALSLRVLGMGRQEEAGLWRQRLWVLLAPPLLATAAPPPRPDPSSASESASESASAVACALVAVATLTAVTPPRAVASLSTPGLAVALTRAVGKAWHLWSDAQGGAQGRLAEALASSALEALHAMASSSKGASSPLASSELTDGRALELAETLLNLAASMGSQNSSNRRRVASAAQRSASRTSPGETSPGETATGETSTGETATGEAPPFGARTRALALALLLSLALAPPQVGAQAGGLAAKRAKQARALAPALDDPCKQVRLLAAAVRNKWAAEGP